MTKRTLFTSSMLAALTLSLGAACGGSDDETDTPAAAAGSAGNKAGSSGKAGTAGATGGTAGAGGTAGKAGTGGTAGKAGTGGTAGKAGSGGTAGKAGSGGTAGKAGSGGTAGKAGAGGAAGKAGAGGSTGGTAGAAGKAGAGGSTGGTAGAAGKAGAGGSVAGSGGSGGSVAGSGGSGGSVAGSGGSGGSVAGAAGAGGDAGAAGAGGDAGAAGTAGSGGSTGDPCTNGTVDGAETDVDCGGGTCGACANGKACVGGADCTSGSCVGSLCVDACTDGVQNNAETAIDCGGGTCPKCAIGSACTAPTDCASGACLNLLCVDSCTDGSQDANETDVDCGGGTCSTCADGLKCVADSDCASAACSTTLVCAQPCADGKKDFAETDVDCGGGTCSTCADGLVCAVDGDCTSGFCSAGLTCVADSCKDGKQDVAETDVDCGGGTCGTCATGLKCVAGTDCASGFCNAAGICEDVLLISEVQTRGDNGGSDEFVEIYNPTSIPVTFDATWSVSARTVSTTVAACNTATVVQFTGNGVVIPPHGHALFVNTAGYNGTTTADGTFTAGISDAASVFLSHGATVRDAVCFAFNGQTVNTIANCPTAFVCEGLPVSNAPHNNTTNGQSNTDVTIERKAGGPLGNGTDTGSSQADFISQSPSNPQNVASPATPLGFGSLVAAPLRFVGAAPSSFCEMRPLDPLSCIPPGLRDEVARLRAEGELAPLLARRYPTKHGVRGDRALYDYVQELKARHLRSAPNVDRVAYDSRLDVAHRALGLHTTRSRVHGTGLRATREIRVASLFEDLAPELLEMIVVHELAHLRHRDHDKAFYQLCVHMQPSYHQRELDARLYLVLAATEPAPRAQR